MSDVAVHPSGRRGTKRLVRGAEIVGTLVQAEDKSWRLFGADRFLLTNETFANANQARDAFIRLEGSPPASSEQLPEPVEIETTGYADARRLIQGGKIVAMLLRHTDDRWGVYDTQERPLFGGRHSTPAKARDAFLNHLQADEKSA